MITVVLVIASLIAGYAFRGLIHGEVVAAGSEAKKIENEVKAKL